MTRLRFLILALLTVTLLVGHHSSASAVTGFLFNLETDIDALVLNPYRIHSVDFDRDGDLDLFVSSEILTDQFAYYENLGSGTWAPAQYLQITTGTLEDSEGLVTGDLDRDGDLDVVACASASTGEDLVWWENTGPMNTWVSRGITSVESGIRSVRLVDLDHDSDLDVVGISSLSEEILWFTNDIEYGTTENWTTTSLGFGPSGNRFEAVDIDGDGDVDLVIPDEGGDSVNWWENQLGDASSWTDHVIDSALDQPRAIAVGDIDGDGDIDVAAPGNSEDEIRWYSNNGNATGWISSPVAINVDGPRDVQLSDLDHDGDLDLVATIAFEDRVAWWENTAGDGSSWQEHTMTGTLDSPEQLVIGDFNGDGLDDVAAAAWLGDRLAWWSGQDNDLTPWSWSKTMIDPSAGRNQELMLIDLDRDGDLDLVAAGFFGTRGVRWWENTSGDGSLWSTDIIIDSGLLGNFSVASADLDNDGDPDLVSSNSQNGEITFRENRLADGLSWIGHSLGTHNSPTSVAAGDIDGDGCADAVSFTDSGAGMTWWSNDLCDGSSWSDNEIAWGATGNALELSDWDSDGDLDIGAIKFGTTNRLYVWTNTTFGGGSGWPATVLTSGSPSDPRDVAAGDLDGDGSADQVLADRDGLLIAWLSNRNGQGGRIAETISTTANGSDDVEIYDVDFDGDNDIIVISRTEGTLSWWENTNAQGNSWSEQLIYSGLDMPDAMAVGDIDGNGTTDVVIANYGNEELFWLRAIPVPEGLLFADRFETGDFSNWNANNTAK